MTSVASTIAPGVVTSRSPACVRNPVPAGTPVVAGVGQPAGAGDAPVEPVVGDPGPGPPLARAEPAGPGDASVVADGPGVAADAGAAGPSSALRGSRPTRTATAPATSATTTAAAASATVRGRTGRRGRPVSVSAPVPAGGAAWRPALKRTPTSTALVSVTSATRPGSGESGHRLSAAAASDRAPSSVPVTVTRQTARVTAIDHTSLRRGDHLCSENHPMTPFMPRETRAEGIPHTPDSTPTIR